ncbi:patatin-like phospholipase family protein [candidate division KSB1 bacterium]|nr:patatin-like phospholipase family protein [candidate division KSB1 bacterium]
MKKKIGLALGGGGARGLCHIEFIKVLDELGLKASIISGTSIGSIIGAFYASGYSGQQMEDLIQEIGLREITKLVDPSFFSIAGLVKGKGILEFLDENLPIHTFEKLKIPLKIIATDYWQQKEVILYKGDLIPAIRASISIPAIFEPVKIGGQVLIDGGVSNPVPYDVIRDQCDLLIAIDVGGTSMIPKKVRVPNMFENIFSTVQILQNAIVLNKMSIAKPDLYYKPPFQNVGLLEFEKYEKIIDSAVVDVERFREAMSAWKNDNKGFKNFFKKGIPGIHKKTGKSKKDKQ